MCLVDLFTRKNQTSHRCLIQEFIVKHFFFSALIFWVFHTMRAIGENKEKLFEDEAGLYVYYSY